MKAILEFLNQIYNGMVYVRQWLGQAWLYVVAAFAAIVPIIMSAMETWSGIVQGIYDALINWTVGHNPGLLADILGLAAYFVPLDFMAANLLLISSVYLAVAGWRVLRSFIPTM